MRGDKPESSAIEVALGEAERKGFRLAVIGRTCALVPIAFFYLVVLSYPYAIYIAVLILAAAGVGLIPLWLVGSRHEHSARYVLFALDVAAISAILAFAPLSSGGDIPQNFVFVSSRDKYYYAVVAVSILALSPALVLWTGFCAVVGLASATLWIATHMERVVTLGDVSPAPSREDFISVVTNPDFLGVATRVAEGMVIALITCLAALAVHRARNVVRAHAAVEEERIRVQRIFGQYVPPQVAEQLIKAGQLAPQQRKASILFADIEGFTKLSESLSPSQIVGLLNSFFSASSALIGERGGIVVNYVGDALIAAFNAPLPIDDYPERAVDAARALLSLVSAREFEGHQLRLRVGVATGTVATGTVGGAEHQTYTLYGDTVNLAQRLEELNKDLQTNCLICGATYHAAPIASTDAVAMGSIQVRGRDASVEAFAINIPPEPAVIRERPFEKGISSELR